MTHAPRFTNLTLLSRSLAPRFKDLVLCCSCLGLRGSFSSLQAWDDLTHQNVISSLQCDFFSSVWESQSSNPAHIEPRSSTTEYSVRTLPLLSPGQVDHQIISIPSRHAHREHPNRCEKQAAFDLCICTLRASTLTSPNPTPPCSKTSGG